MFKLYEDMLSLLQRVDNEFDSLSRLDSPESVNPNEKLWEEVSNKIEEFKTLLKLETST